MDEDVSSCVGESGVVSMKTVGEKRGVRGVAERVGEGGGERVAEELGKPEREEVVDEDEGIDGVCDARREEWLRKRMALVRMR